MPDPTVVEGLLTIEEAADRLRISSRHLRTLIYEGKLPSVQIGRRRLLRPVDLNDYIDANLR